MAPRGVSLVNILNTRASSDREARANSLKYIGSILLIVHLMDICCSIWAVLSTGSFEDSYEKFVSSPSDIFSESVFDFLLLSILRAITFPLLTFVGSKWGADMPFKCSSVCCEVVEKVEDDNDNDDDGEKDDGIDLSKPLLDPLSTPSTSPTPSLSEPPLSKSSNRKTRFTPDIVKVIVLFLLFLLSTSIQVYLGFRVSSYTFSSSLLPILLCLSVLWINLTVYLHRSLLDELTRPSGLFLPSVHRHPVFLQKGLAFHWCDLCRTRIKGGAGAFRCKLCDFDMCLKCAKRKDAAIVSENMLRGDKGVRSESTVSNGAYFGRALSMAKGEAPLLFLSFSLLILYCLSGLYLPNYQGKIIDHVVPDEESGDYDESGFKKDVKIYIYIMLAQGAFSTIYSAAFQLVSRRLVFNIRNALFRKILVQDVAYFDGTESGRLISRLTNDVNMMMQPIQSSLSSLLSNSFMLVGGLVFCYVKSYRLSMLAFVTVGPIMYVWDVYAKWSKRLNRQMLSSWAEGNSIASQALSHIRTVKAFGTEKSEIKQYNDANREALRAGVKDAWGNGLTTALTSYLDLGTGVLILYYGGTLVMNGEMSVGELVTFQLYWNMMNNAYQNLQGLVTSFTRSAAGAEKVFSLWDSAPDIDPNDGGAIDWGVEGEIEFSKVDYFYQMRPDNMVLSGLDLKIKKGSVVGLVGRSGGGKTTLIKMLLRFYDPKAGSITLDGRPYTSLKVDDLRSLFGVVSQDTELFAKTVEENISYGMKPGTYTHEDVVEAAKAAQAHDFIKDVRTV